MTSPEYRIVAQSIGYGVARKTSIPDRVYAELANATADSPALRC